MNIQDLQLDSIALIRSRANGDDEAFDALLEGKDVEELKSILSFTAAFSALTLQELLERLSMAISGRAPWTPDKMRTVDAYLDSAIQEITNPTKEPE